ncbi:MAG: CheB methylesterase domain-containing protein [Syntrophales bacterium]|nr:CheB methylesterase domain-containing protein [Syntrophales bacterium]
MQKIIAIASSAGGPKALSILLAGLPESFGSSVVVAQHIPDDFISGLVEWLNRESKIEVKRAEQNEPILPGTVYISPSIKHMTVDHSGRVALKEKRPGDVYFPSCDLLLASVADVFGPGSIGVVLSGMGSDGMLGLKSIKAVGGQTIAQDKKTAAIFGMPKAAIDNGCIDSVLPIEEISEKILSLVGGEAP